LCYEKLKQPTHCERCNEEHPTVLHHSRTAYHDKRMIPDEYDLSKSRWLNLEIDLPEPSAEFGEIERKLDPNRPYWLCDECVKEDVAYWDEMWEEYYRDVL
jgi:hypothetical protein